MGLDTQVLGISVDHVPCLQAWADTFGGISYPLTSDFWPHGEIAKRYGVFRPDGRSERAIFVVDKQGILRWSKVYPIDEQPENEELRKVLRMIDPVAAAREPKVEEEKPEEQPLPKGGVVMYCTKWCPGCNLARRWFAEHGIEFVEVDVNKVPGAAEQVMKWADGSRTTPTFDINGTIIVNWNERKLREALGID